MRRLSLIFSLIFIFSTTLLAESVDSTSIRLGNRAFGFGIGKEKHHVSYLSPLLYSGSSFEFWNETTKNQKFKSSDFYSVLNNRIHFSPLSPESESTLMEAIYDVFKYHEYYDLKLTRNFHLLLGAYAGFEFGVDMLMSNSNNPLYVRADLNLLGLSLNPTLCFRTKRRLIKISNQFDLRLAGIVFSPTYTQLYYDLTLPDYDRKEFFDLNSFSEKIRVEDKFMVELQLRRRTLRLGLLWDRSKSEINFIDNRTTNIQGLIGWSFDYYHLQGRLDRDSRFSTVFE